MALKDWKKTPSKGNLLSRWDKKDGKKTIGLSRYKNGSYSMDIVSINGGWSSKSFKTKSQAMAYAKAYLMLDKIRPRKRRKK